MSVVIDDFNVEAVTCRLQDIDVLRVGRVGHPPEAETPLIIDPNGVLPFSVRLQRLELIGWRIAKVAQPMGCL